ncbi:MAG: hypothetical protein ACK42I_06195, partial [Thermomicrobium sp.]
LLSPLCCRFLSFRLFSPEQCCPHLLAAVATRHAGLWKTVSAIVREAVLPRLHSAATRVRAYWTPRVPEDAMMAVVAGQV